jgi:nucleoside-diphosphate-sugar epimerase
MRILITGGSGFIGTNLIDWLLRSGVTIVNVDIDPPKLQHQRELWRECDILDRLKLSEIFTSFKPEAVVHLAARTDVEGRWLIDYRANTDGSRHVLECVADVGSVQRIIITSTQFVHQFKGTPQNDTDYAPYTVYGQSKMITEQLTRQASLACTWSIIRPTNIWGPWHPRYPHEFWKTISAGYYVHPGKAPVKRSYGYVGNVVWQITRILELPHSVVNQRVFYVGDEPINLLDWVNGFSRKQIGKDVRIIPRSFVKILALWGDLLSWRGLSFPITTSRFRSMTTSNEAPMNRTYEVLGTPPYTLEQGIDQTVAWMKQYFPQLVKVKVN